LPKVIGVDGRRVSKNIGASGPEHRSFTIDRDGNENQTGADLGINLYPVAINVGFLEVIQNFAGERILADSPDKADIHIHPGQGDGSIDRRPPRMHLNGGGHCLMARDGISRNGQINVYIDVPYDDYIGHKANSSKVKLRR
jgi:hypothetical protein